MIKVTIENTETKTVVTGVAATLQKAYDNAYSALLEGKLYKGSLFFKKEIEYSEEKPLNNELAKASADFRERIKRNKEVKIGVPSKEWMDDIDRRLSKLEFMSKPVIYETLGKDKMEEMVEFFDNDYSLINRIKNK